MTENLPAYVPAVFILTTFATAAFLFYAVKNTRARYLLPAAVVFWMGITAILANAGFYTETSAFPPRIFLIGALPALLLGVAACVFVRTSFLETLPLGALTLLHVVRVPVETTLYSLYEYGWIPEVMTFAGRNLDIVSGITAPIVYLVAFRGERVNRLLLIIWNLAAMALLVNIVLTAVAAFPSPAQSLAFEQPNRAVMHFPFVWLPSIIVPAVFFAHLASLVRLFRNKI